METIGRKHSFYRPLFIDEKQVDRIIFFDNKGNIYTHGYGYFDNDISLQVTQVKRCRGINDDTKKQEFINKMTVNAKEPMNFCMNTGKKEFDGTTLVDLYLFIDGTYIKEIEITDKDEIYKSEYSLSKTKNTYRNCTFEIWKDTVTFSRCIKSEELDTKEIQDLLEKTVKELKQNSIFIDKSAVAQILNSFELVKRDVKLLDDEREVEHA